MFDLKSLVDLPAQRMCMDKWFVAAGRRFVDRGRSLYHGQDLEVRHQPGYVQHVPHYVFMYLIVNAFFKLVKHGQYPCLQTEPGQEGRDVAMVTSFSGDLEIMTACAFMAAVEDGVFETPLVYENDDGHLWVIAAKEGTLYLLPLTDMLSSTPAEEQERTARGIVADPPNFTARLFGSPSVPEEAREIPPGSDLERHIVETRATAGRFIAVWQSEDLTVDTAGEAMDLSAWRQQLTPDVVMLAYGGFAATLTKLIFDAGPPGAVDLPEAQLRRNHEGCYEFAITPLAGSRFRRGSSEAEVVVSGQELATALRLRAGRSGSHPLQHEGAESIFVQAFCQSLARGELTLPDLVCEVRDEVTYVRLPPVA